MQKELLNIIPYNEVNFKWISNHYDYHLNGLCIYNNKLCEFVTKKNNWCIIFRLYGKTKIKWILRKILFEFCVGYHQTYTHSQLKKWNNFYYRKPKWLYKKLFILYFNYLNKI